MGDVDISQVIAQIMPGLVVPSKPQEAQQPVSTALSQAIGHLVDSNSVHVRPQKPQQPVSTGFKDNKTLSQAIHYRNTMILKPNVSHETVMDIKMSRAYQHPWQTFLQQVPLTITAVGVLYLAGSCKAARQVVLEAPSQGFRYLEDRLLTASLVKSAHQGRTALANVVVAFQGTFPITQMMADKHQDAASIQLQPQLRTLQNAIDGRYKAFLEVDTSLEAWLMHTVELYAVCVGHQADDSEKLQAIALALSAEKTKFDSGTPADREVVKEKLARQLDSAYDAFKTGSDGSLKAWALLDRHVVSGMVDMMTSTFGQVIARSIADVTPMTRAQNATGLFDDILQPPKGNASEPPLQMGPLPVYSSDPAYANLQKDLPYLILLWSFAISGKNGGPDWAALRATPSVLDHISEMLHLARQQFDRAATNNPPSRDLSDILTMSNQVLKEMKEASKSFLGLGDSAYPLADSPQIKQWQASPDQIFVKALTLASVARSLAGTAPAGVVLYGVDLPGKEPDADPTEARAFVELVRSRFYTAYASLSCSQELYQNSLSTLQTQRDRVDDILGTLEVASHSNMGMEEIKMVLESVVRLVINMKVNIVNMCAIYRSVSAAISALSSTVVKSFLDPGRLGDKSVSDCNLKALERSVIYAAVITVLAYIKDFEEVAKAWGVMGRDYIVPGLKISEELAYIDDSGQAQRAIRNLYSWAKASNEHIEEVATQSGSTQLDDMFLRTSELEDIIMSLPVSPAIRDAISAGVDIRKKAAEASITYNNDNSPLKRSAR